MESENLYRHNSEDDFLFFSRQLTFAGEYELAINECLDILRYNPLSAEAFLELSKNQLSLYLFSQALDSLDQATEIDPYCAEALIRKAFIYIQQSRYDSSYTTLLQALSVNPRCIVTRIGLSLCLIHQNLFSEAIEHLRIGASLAPWDENINLLLSTLLEKEGHSEQSLSLISDFMSHYPESIEMKSHYAYILLRSGYIYKSSALFEELLNICPDSFKIRLGACMAAYECGDLTTLRAHYTRLETCI